jgi:4-amino-4-deoxy-L-arabinose transferase-like glycosyltransferase
MVNKNKILIFLVLVLAFVLRFYRLGDYPALNADEAAIGYNVYSLIETGRDEHGNAWPIHFQSFNDYKPGLYFYMVLPFVKFFGLNTWAVRIPSAALGVVTIYIVYLLVKELFISYKIRSPITDHRSLALISALLLAISPWHLHFSRGGWEVNVATFFITLGVLLFLKALKSPKLYALCVISFTLSLYTYHSARVIVPLLGLGLLVICRENIKSNMKHVVVAVLLGIVLLTPLGVDMIKGDVLSRAAGVGLFADPGVVERINEQRSQHSNFQGPASLILHNKAVNYSLAFFENWGEHFWGEFLFLSGDEVQRNRVPETGQMYLFSVLFLVVGFWFILKIIVGPPSQNATARRGWFVVLLWMLIGPTAAALTFQSPHALRAQNMVIPLTIISSLGFLGIIRWSRNLNIRYLKYFGFLSLGILVFWNFLRYQHMYWVHMAKEYPFSSQYGVKELVAYIEKEKDGHKDVIVTERYDQPYILFLFYLKYPPAKFQNDHVLTEPDRYGFSTVNSFDKYRFEPIDWEKTSQDNPGSLIVGANEEIPDETEIAKEIYGTNGYKYFKVVKN